MLSIIVRVEAKSSASTANGEWSRNVSLPRPQYIHYLFYFPSFFNDLHVFILCPQISMGMEQEAKRLISTPTIYIPISKKVASVTHVS